METIQKMFEQLQKFICDKIEQNPYKMMLIALIVGFVLGAYHSWKGL